LVIAEHCDGVEHATTMADRRDAKLAQVLGRQTVQNLPIDVVIAEGGRVSFEPEAAQPFCNIHSIRPKLARRGADYIPSMTFCPGRKRYLHILSAKSWQAAG